MLRDFKEEAPKHTAWNICYFKHAHVSQMAFLPGLP